MLSTYQALARLALDEFGTQGLNIVTRATFVGGTPASPNKLRPTIRTSILSPRTCTMATKTQSSRAI
jgi:hypothetical protein